MSRLDKHGQMRTTRIQRISEIPSPRRIAELLNINRFEPERLTEGLPFGPGDTTAGVETELQAVVVGRKNDVDLPVVIERSNYYANIVRRARAGDTSRKLLDDLTGFIENNPERIWENSWVRFPRSALSPCADEIFQNDLLADKQDRGGGFRMDFHKFIFYEGDGEFLRVPVSYLLRIALADFIHTEEAMPRFLRSTGIGLMDHFLNDNTSPETHSFYVSALTPRRRMGAAIARETAIRYLFTQLLVMYANEKFALREHGQRAVVFMSPHPPIRQKKLNDLISDAFYRELFMNPCLAGWDRGQEKCDYMHLCHEVLSRSQLNAVAKLREAGIVWGNLVVLPNMSNISLANNGTHISLGSRRLSKLIGDPASGFTNAHEKYMGDLIIKVFEHFLPFFVGTYTAAPYRLDFADFHPEKVLGFLPHELDYTHLRMFWRRWRKKANMKIFGHPFTPSGIARVDRAAAGLFRLRGDFVPDIRLVDYLVSLMSTERSPALDGMPGNSDQLKKDLADLGVFNTKMSLYLLYKLREFGAMGFSGFEGRHYSLFENFGQDMTHAVNLQNLINALAFKYILKGEVTHAHIPDDPFIESERRQIIFGAAVGIPTFYVRKNTPNLFLTKILEKTEDTRISRRYPGYIRVYNAAYRSALLRILKEDAADLAEALGLTDTLEDLETRLGHPGACSAAGKLQAGILQEANARSPLELSAEEFNGAAEKYYRTGLRRQQMEESFRFLEVILERLDKNPARIDPNLRRILQISAEGRSPADFVRTVTEDVIAEQASLEEIRKLIRLIIVHVCVEKREEERFTGQAEGGYDAPPVFRAGNE